MLLTEFFLKKKGEGSFGGGVRVRMVQLKETYGLYCLSRNRSVSAYKSALMLVKVSD